MLDSLQEIAERYEDSLDNPSGRIYRGKAYQREETNKKDDTEPEIKISDFLDNFQASLSELSEKEQDEHRNEYFDWVKLSLRDKVPIIDEKRIQVQMGESIVICTHDITKMFGMDSSGENDHLRKNKAMENLSDRLDAHLKYWTKTSEDFKRKYNLVSG